MITTIFGVPGFAGVNLMSRSRIGVFPSDIHELPYKVLTLGEYRGS